METIKIFFKSKNLMIRTTVTLLNWLTNTLVYYGISFNTSELAGDPFLNFSLSVFVELIAIVTCQFTLERFGRKKPYAINMAVTGVALMFIQFVPKEMPYLITILALTGKFAISFTYNGIYIITAEIHPTVIRFE
jgi:OCT family organic cation transporter-like MFS transporter 4/5